MRRRYLDLVRKASGLVAARASIATTRVVRVTTLVARQMARLPAPPLRPAERVVLTAARDQLRALAGVAIVDASDEAQGAVADLLAATLDLVDALLVEREPLERGVRGVLSSGDKEETRDE